MVFLDSPVITGAIEQCGLRHMMSNFLLAAHWNGSTFEYTLK